MNHTGIQRKQINTVCLTNLIFKYKTKLYNGKWWNYDNAKEIISSNGVQVCTSLIWVEFIWKSIDVAIDDQFSVPMSFKHRFYLFIYFKHENLTLFLCSFPTVVGLQKSCKRSPREQLEEEMRFIISWI